MGRARACSSVGRISQRRREGLRRAAARCGRDDGVSYQLPRIHAFVDAFEFYAAAVVGSRGSRGVFRQFPFGRDASYDWNNRSRTLVYFVEKRVAADGDIASGNGDFAVLQREESSVGILCGVVGDGALFAA